MEQKHRDAIRRCFSSLVERTDLDLMVAALYEKGVFSDAMIEPYKDTTKDQRTRRRQLYRDITRRGPDAFQNLLDTLSENGYWDLVRELDPNSSLHPKPRPAPPNRLNPGGSPFLSIAEKKKNTGKEQEDPNRNKGDERKSTSSEGESSKSQEGNGNTGPGDTGDASEGVRKFHVVKSTRFFEDIGNDIKLYRTRGRNRGVLVQFSYITFDYGEPYRAGANVDADNLKDLFGDLGFKVRTYRDLKLKETKETLESLHTAEGMCEGPECVFIVFSSHGYGRGAGTGDTELRCSDGHLISYYDIIAHFNNDKFPALKGIPKVFVFQTCRGPKDNVRLRPPKHLHAPHQRHDTHPLSPADLPRPDSPPDTPPPPPHPAPGDRLAADGATVFRDEDSDDSDDTARDRIYSDILIAHSTVPGYVSSRDEVNGSWFIQALCEVFAARAHDCHVEKLFTLVDEKLHKHFSTQTSSVDRWGFNRRLYLHPGLYED